MMDDTLGFMDATEQAALVRSGEIGAAELLDATARRVEAVDTRLNSIVHADAERALTEARVVEAAVDGDVPFAGVPLVVKDVGITCEGWPASWGNRLLRDLGHRDPQDSWLMQRYRRAGFVLLGRTNTPEFGLLPMTEPLAFGPTRNPWDLDRSAGGSSGGSAAAVAAGLVAVAHGADGGGSIRIPAAMCGCVGLKVTRGRITMGPDGDESGTVVPHVLTRSVRDCAAVLDATHGPAPGHTSFAPPPTRPYLDALAHPLRGLRIGFLDANPDGALHPECAEAVRGAAAQLEQLGHRVECAHPGALDESAASLEWVARWFVDATVVVDTVAEIAGRPLGPDDVESLTWVFSELGRQFSGADHARALAAAAAWGRRLSAWWDDGFDLLLTPTLAGPPPPLGAQGSRSDDPFESMLDWGARFPFTSAFNISGQPAISVPFTTHSDGMPLGLQFVATAGREDILLNVAAQLEQATGWTSRRPGEVTASSGAGAVA